MHPQEKQLSTCYCYHRESPKISTGEAPLSPITENGQLGTLSFALPIDIPIKAEKHRTYLDPAKSQEEYMRNTEQPIPESRQ